MRASLNYLTIEQAEALAGKRLDRRRKYFLWDHGFGNGREVSYDAKWLAQCSGCYDDGEYGELIQGTYDATRKMYIGGGCEECGYTGVRWQSCPVPVDGGLEALI